MSRVHFDLPAPMDGTAWCLVCAMVLKHRIHTELENQIKAAQDDGKPDGVERFDIALRPLELQTAQVAGLVEGLEGWGVIDVCWDHLGGLAPQRKDDQRLQAGRRSIEVPRGFQRGRG